MTNSKITNEKKKLLILSITEWAQPIKNHVAFTLGVVKNSQFYTKQSFVWKPTACSYKPITVIILLKLNSIVFTDFSKSDPETSEPSE